MRNWGVGADKTLFLLPIKKPFRGLGPLSCAIRNASYRKIIPGKVLENEELHRKKGWEGTTSE